MNKHLLFTLLITCSILIVSCSKDKKQERKIIGKWEIEDYLIDSTDIKDMDSLYYSRITFEFDKDGDVEQAWQEDRAGYSYTSLFQGTWNIVNEELDLDFGNNSASHYFTGDTLSTSESYDILKLDKTKLRLTGVFNGIPVTIIGKKQD